MFGTFMELGGFATRSVARLLHTGGVDATFRSGLSGSNINVQTAALQPNGRIVVGGPSVMMAGPNLRLTLARLLPDGPFDASLDATLNPNSEVFAVAVQPDGGLLVGGQFTSVGTGAAHLALLRLLDSNVLHAAAGVAAPRT